jgi:hypothetical protein
MLVGEHPGGRHAGAIDHALLESRIDLADGHHDRLTAQRPDHAVVADDATDLAALPIVLVG